MEIRLNRIITQLDKIVSLLEKIRDNQYTMYVALQESNNKINEIVNSNQRIEMAVQGIEAQGQELNDRIANLQITSALNMYFNALTQKEMSYKNRMGL